MKDGRGNKGLYYNNFNYTDGRWRTGKVSCSSDCGSAILHRADALRRTPRRHMLQRLGSSLPMSAAFSDANQFARQRAVLTLDLEFRERRGVPIEAAAGGHRKLPLWPVRRKIAIKFCLRLHLIDNCRP